jgi:hypothetical protein
VPRNCAHSSFCADGVLEATATLWTCDAGDAIESSAAIAGDLVFVGAAAGELVALNFSDGKKR